MSEGRQYLDEVLEKITIKTAEVEREIRDLNQDIEQMHEYYWENYTEMDEYGYENYDNQQALRLSVDEHAERRKKLSRLRKMQDSPFFGRVDFQYDDDDEVEKFYIGIGNFSMGNGCLPLIYDWRAPVCSLYYDYDKGEASYEAPMGTLTGYVHAKYQYKIRDGRMIYEVKSDFNIDDEILREELSKNGETALKNIVRTIQKEQNSIVRNTKDKILVIQGSAGSGKTSIALHRIAYLLYHDRKRLNSSNVLILSPNSVFSDYIAHILPELGEENIREMTLDLFAYRELKGLIRDCEDRYDHMEKLIRMEQKVNRGKLSRKKFDEYKSMCEYKQSAAFISDFEEFILELEADLVDFHDMEYKKMVMTAAEIEKLFYDRFADTPILSRIQMICDRFIDEYETLYGNLKEEEEFKIREMFGNLPETDDFYDLYNRFLEQMGMKQLPDASPEKRVIPYEDVYPLLYIKYKMQNPDPHMRIRHLVVDEMQDYTYLQYMILERMFPCSKTILGDFAQTMEEKDRDVLEFLPKIMGKDTRLIRINKSYRNTTQISAYADSICHLDNIEYFDRPGTEVGVHSVPSLKEGVEKAAALLCEAGEKEYETKAFLAMTLKDAEEVHRILDEKEIPHSFITADSSEFKKGLTVAPFYLVKGLEFDQVYVMPSDERLSLYKKYHYICATRALHELQVLENIDCNAFCI